MVKCPYLFIFVKGMHKMMQSISKNIYKKNMLIFMQLHVHYVNLMKTNHMKMSKSLNFEAKVARKMIPLLNNLVIF